MRGVVRNRGLSASVFALAVAVALAGCPTKSTPPDAPKGPVVPISEAARASAQGDWVEYSLGENRRARKEVVRATATTREVVVTTFEGQARVAGPERIVLNLTTMETNQKAGTDVFTGEPHPAGRQLRTAQCTVRGAPEDCIVESVPDGDTRREIWYSVRVPVDGIVKVTDNGKPVVTLTNMKRSQPQGADGPE